MKKGRSTREELIDAMFEALRIHGYQGVSLSALLKKIGIPKGSMYHYFSSKKDLVECVIKERLEPEIEAELLFFARSGRSPIDAVVERIEELKMNDSGLNERFLLLPLLIETSETEPDLQTTLRNLYRRLFDSLKRVLDTAERNGDIHPIDCDALSHFLLTLLMGSISLSRCVLDRSDYIKNLTLAQEYLKSLKLSKKEKPKHIQQTLF